MGANIAEISQTTRSIHPNSLANLQKFEPGNRANPGGFRKNNVRGDLVYQRLASMKTELLREYEPQNALEEGVKNCILRACDADSPKAAHLAIKELVDRLDGKATQRQQLDVNVNIEETREFQVKAYRLVFLQKPLDVALGELRQIYATQADEAENEQVICEVLEADEAAIEQVREQAAALVLASK